MELLIIYSTTIPKILEIKLYEEKGKGK